MSGMIQPDRAMVLAAGLGTRMRPLTEDTPKPLIEVAGRPIIDHVLGRLADAGVRQVAVNLHYQADRLARPLACRTVPQVQTILVDRLLDTDGGIRNALGLLGRDPFYVVNADIVWLEGPVPVLHQLAAQWDGRGWTCCWCLRPGFARSASVHATT